MLHPTAPWGALLGLAGAALIWATRQGTVAGALAGLLVALPVAAGFGAAGIAPLALFVLGSGVLTRLGRKRKESFGAAEDNLGRRGVSHVAAKLSLPALAGALAAAGAAPPPVLALVYSAALAGAFADTAATETGPLASGRVWGLRGFRLVQLRHGAPGGVSAAGLIASAIASALVALTARSVGLLGGSAGAWAVCVSGFGAGLLEGVLAGTPMGTRLGHWGKNVFVSLAAGVGALAAHGLGWAGA